MLAPWGLGQQFCPPDGLTQARGEPGCQAERSPLVTGVVLKPDPRRPWAPLPRLAVRVLSAIRARFFSPGSPPVPASVSLPMTSWN